MICPTSCISTNCCMRHKSVRMFSPIGQGLGQGLEQGLKKGVELELGVELE